MLQICQSWIRQCFWNYLDWTEICHYIVLCTLLGVDYQVYTCVAILKHLQNDILHHQQQQDLVIFLRVSLVSYFRCLLYQLCFIIHCILCALIACLLKLFTCCPSHIMASDLDNCWLQKSKSSENSNLSLVQISLFISRNSRYQDLR